ncbi:MAG: hypothetical protein QXE33_03315 [Candidatus Micrarchaeaceae archaeon]
MTETAIKYILGIIIAVIALFAVILMYPHRTPTQSNQTTATTSIVLFTAPSISGYSLEENYPILSSSPLVVFSNNFTSGHALVYDSINATILLRVLTYINATDAMAAYNYITNYTGVANVTVLTNMPRNYSGAMQSGPSSILYSITAVKNDTVLTATAIQNPGGVLEESAALNSLFEVINKTASELI